MQLLHVQRRLQFSVNRVYTRRQAVGHRYFIDGSDVRHVLRLLGTTGA